MKRVRVKCYGPIAVEPLYRQPWVDLWIRFSAKPGRRRYEFAPTLLSRRELEVDLRQFRKDVHEFPEFASDIARLETIAVILESQSIYVDPMYPDPRDPNIYTAASWIDRSEANRMLGAFLKALGHHRVKFHWSRQRFVIEPLSLGSTFEAEG